MPGHCLKSFFWQPEGLKVKTGSGRFRFCDLATVDFLSFNDLSFSTRAYVWKRALPVARRGGLWGWGLGHFSFVFPHDCVNYDRIFPDGALIDKAHQMYLRIWIELGALGLALFLGLLGTVFWQAYKRPWGRQTHAYLYATLSFLFMGC